MTGDHSSKQYDTDLETIRSKVLSMGGIVERQFQDAMEAFRDCGSGTSNGKAEQVIRDDDSVNALEVSLDDACTNLIVRRQPTANDLRAVMATIKIITDLERIGDEATKIARISLHLQKRGSGPIKHYEMVHAIAKIADEMLHSALDALAHSDQVQAKALIAKDVSIDDGLRNITRTLVTFMTEDPRTISTAIDTMWVAKAIERIGDHAKNIAEYVIYVVGGKDIRHTDYALTDQPPEA